MKSLHSIPVDENSAVELLAQLAADHLMDGVSRGKIDRCLLQKHGLRIEEVIPLTFDSSGPKTGRGDVEMAGWLIEAGAGKEQAVLLVCAEGVAKLERNRFHNVIARPGFRWASEGEAVGRAILDVVTDDDPSGNVLLKKSGRDGKPADVKDAGDRLDGRASGLLRTWLKKSTVSGAPAAPTP
jgi:hypothetical protein